MSGEKFILQEKRKSHYELEQSVFSVVQQPTGPATYHGLSKTDVPRTDVPRSEKFLSSYRMATSKPFGYLFIDLKPDTPNDKHLWPKVFEQTNKVPTAEQPYFYYSEQKAGGRPKKHTDPRSHLNFRTLNTVNHTLW